MSKPCPRCHGWVVIEDGYCVCISCGYESATRVVPDESNGYRELLKRGELFQRQVRAIERWKGETELTRRYDRSRFRD